MVSTALAFQPSAREFLVFRWIVVPGIMVGTTVDFLQRLTGLTSVVFCLFSADAFEVFQAEMEGFSREDRKEP